MKVRVLIAAVVMISLLSGCGLPAALIEAQLPRQEDVLRQAEVPAETTAPEPAAPVETQPAAPVETQPAAPAQPGKEDAAASQITAAKAKSIALSHAGLSAGQVTGLRASLDRDDGRLEYDVEFRKGSVEYEYEIHAETGKILSWDKDKDD